MRIMRSLMSLLLLSMILTGATTYGNLSQDELSCYSGYYNLELGSRNDILIETLTQDFIVIQNNTTIRSLDVGESYKYIPYVSNIGSQNTGFTSIDTKENKTIELDIPELSTNNFQINFQHDAKYHIPKYYISEDGETYDQVTARNIADFRISKVKIVFESTRQEDIREIINISTLNIERKNFISSLDINTANDIDIYFNNTCNSKNITLEASDTVLENAIIYDVLEPQNHGLYLQRTTDSDTDGVMDLYDNCKFLSNSDQTDINQNRIGDACEFDSDNDGIADEIDNCRNDVNPGQEDDDKDKIGNACDNCKLYNPRQLDINASGVGDVCEQRQQFILENDTDADGIIDSLDNCKLVANSDQADDDNDGVGNSCDNCRVFQNYDQIDLNENGVGDICEDSDGDGVDSINDNCINIANPDQGDDDNDGVGNLCEDEDRDSIVFSLDNCPYKTNRDQQDTDGDGIGDVCDEQDDRLLESNKEIFIVLLFLLIGVFVGGIVYVARKIQK